MARSDVIVFVGAGNMASAIVRGLLRAGVRAPASIRASDVRSEALAALRDAHGIETSTDNREAVRDAATVVLAVKPQVLPEVLDALAPGLPSDALVVSIAAGVPTSAIEARLAPGARVVRAMPNTPALVGAGATGLCQGARATDTDLATAEALFAAVGIVVRVDEAQMNAVTALSGSGPAYVFRLVEALADAGTRVGLSREDASQLASATVIGAAALLRDTREAPEVLRERVTSPGGTTAAGLRALAERGFHDALAVAVEQATARARELGDEATKKLARR